MIEFEPIRLTSESVDALRGRFAEGADTDSAVTHAAGVEIGATLPLGLFGDRLPDVAKAIAEQVGYPLGDGIAEGYELRLQRAADAVRGMVMECMIESIEPIDPLAG